MKVKTHPRFVQRVVLQAEQAAAPLAALQGRRRGRGQQAGRLGDHGGVGRGGEGTRQREALQLPLPLQHLAHGHLLLLVEEKRWRSERAVLRPQQGLVTCGKER